MSQGGCEARKALSRAADSQLISCCVGALAVLRAFYGAEMVSAVRRWCLQERVSVMSKCRLGVLQG